MNDNQLIKQLKKSPSDGLQEVIKLYGGAVKTICTNILGRNNQEDIEESISDTFMKLWNSLDRFDAEAGSLKSYIYSIARFTAIDRRRKTQSKAPLLPIAENEIEIDVDFTNDISKKINSQIIQAAVDDLPSPDREIFIYRYYYYESAAEIAHRLALTVKTVENKLYRGKTKLKKTLLERGIIL